MDMTIDQQVALDEALVPHASRLRIGKSNFRLRSDITGEIKKITDVNINKLHQPWRSFAVVINKCLSGKSTDHDIEHKDAKKSNEMYYPRFTKVIINFFMTKDPSIPRRNKVNWNYVRDDQMFTTIKLVSRHQNTQQFETILPVELTNKDIRNSAAYKEYYAIASGAEPPKTKASVRKTQSSSDTTIPPLVAKGTRLQTLAKSSDDDDDDDVQQSEHDEDSDDQNDDESHDDQEDDDDQDDKDDDQIDSDNDGDDFVHPKFSTPDEEAKDEESFDPIVQTPSHVENSNDEASHGMNFGGDEGPNAEGDDNELYGDLNINLEGIDSFFESTPRVDVPVTTTVEPLLLTSPTLPPPPIPIISQVQQAPDPSPTTAPSTSLQDLPNFGSLFGFDHRLKTLEANFSEFMQTNQSDKHQLFHQQLLQAHQMNEAVKVATSYVVAVDLSELELKKILIEKIESNKSIHRSDQQKYLYKALVDAYECDKIILDTYGDMVTLKRRRDDEDKDKEPSAGSDRGSKRRRAGKEPESTNAPKEKTSKTSGKSTEGSKSQQKTASESTPAEEPMHITQDLKEPAHQEFETGATDDQPIAEASQHPEWFQKQAKPPTPDRAWNKTLPATHEHI
uniref:Uncharacterized protein n=1 Tax=Tanacetum cinerariifolium TaxID=118510 RepID=A0A6L2LZV5_TANCI|nr:hypothetical protein [Tanacetum cinerariifolium]